MIWGVPTSGSPRCCLLISDESRTSRRPTCRRHRTARGAAHLIYPYLLSDLLFDQITLTFQNIHLHICACSTKMTPLAPIRVLIAGGSYAGLSAAVHLIDLCQGIRTRFPAENPPLPVALKGFPLDVHIVDERDGYCS